MKFGIFIILDAISMEDMCAGIGGSFRDMSMSTINPIKSMRCHVVLQLDSCMSFSKADDECTAFLLYGTGYAFSLVNTLVYSVAVIQPVIP